VTVCSTFSYDHRTCYGRDLPDLLEYYRMSHCEAKKGNGTQEQTRGSRRVLEVRLFRGSRRVPMFQRGDETRKCDDDDESGDSPCVPVVGLWSFTREDG